MNLENDFLFINVIEESIKRPQDVYGQGYSKELFNEKFGF